MPALDHRFVSLPLAISRAVDGPSASRQAARSDTAIVAMSAFWWERVSHSITLPHSAYYARRSGAMSMFWRQASLGIDGEGRVRRFSRPPAEYFA